jgi:hypothetical protein
MDKSVALQYQSSTVQKVLKMVGKEKQDGL